MAGHWTQQGVASDVQVSAAAMVDLLQDLEHRSPGSAALRFLSKAVAVDYLSLVGYAADGLPRQIEAQAAAWHQRQTTLRCFALYRSRFYWHDEATALAAELHAADPEAARVEVLHYGQRDIPEPVWREEIFVRERLAGRLTLMFCGHGDRVYALNLYRDLARGEFDDDEVGILRRAAPLLRATLRPRLEAARTDSGVMRLERLHERLAERAPGLARREAQVGVRIACGMSNDGIAADLGISPSTVHTLRKRLYAKLDIHSRMALVWLLR